MSRSRRPWMKFYPADWRADPKLRMCSIGARGLWVEMMCLMHEADPYGSLLVNGQCITEKQIASLLGIPAKEVAAFIVELECAGVFSRDDGGTIYSRRMRRDAEKAKEDQENGKAGGNPSLKGGVNPPVNGGDKAQNLEPRTENQEKKEDRPKRVRTLCSATFEEFWKAYPRTPNMSKKEAWRVWQKLSEEDQSSATAAVPKYSAWLKSKPDHPVVHACRFLSQRRFDGFNESEPTNVVPIGFYAAFGSAQLDAWDAHNRKIKGINMPRDSRGGWLCAAEWPPGYEPQTAAG